MIEFTLRQHTPIIHFQHDQAGATLRATEVKPKLDRFIIDHFRHFNQDGAFKDKILEKFGVRADNRPSSYRMRIESLAKPDRILVTSYLSIEQQDALERAEIEYLMGVPYFATEEPIRKQLFRKTGRKVKRKGRNDNEYDELEVNNNPYDSVPIWGLMALNRPELLLTIQSFDPDVVKLIERAISSFFICTNFGTRQTKGFGSFTVGQPTIAEIQEATKMKYKYRYSYNDRFRDDNRVLQIEKQLSFIQEDYRLIKSGNSARLPGGYRKAQTFLYGVKQQRPVRWEKRFIKTKINGSLMAVNGKTAQLKVERGNAAVVDADGRNTWQDPPGIKYEYLRAMLGLAEQYEFQTDLGFKHKYKVSVENKKGVERFPSPLFWKIIDDRIYLLANNVNPQMLNVPFNFKVELDMSKDKAKTIGPISTPQNFDLGEFLEFCFSNGPEIIEGYTKY